MSTRDTKEPRGDTGNGSAVESGDAEVRRLLRAAGRRPAPAERDLAEIRSVARDAWRETVRERRRRQRRRFLPGGLRVAALAAGLIVAVLVALWWTRIERRPAAGVVVATVERSSGAVHVDGEPIGPGGEVTAGAEISTASVAGGAPPRVALRLTDGQSLRLDAETVVRLASTRHAELAGGAVYVDSPPGGDLERRLDVVTSLGTVVEIGTQFEVRLDEAAGVLDVRVREGAVSVRREGRSVTASVGEGLTVRRDGSVSRHAVPVAGAEWDWVVELAPPLTVRGLTVAAILAKASRELGWEIDYASDEAEAVAARAVVEGALDGLGPADAVTVALRGSGLEHEVHDGMLTVFRP